MKITRLLVHESCLLWSQQELEEDCVNHETKGAQLMHARDDQLWGYFMLQIPPGGVAEKGEKEIRALQEPMWLFSGNVAGSTECGLAHKFTSLIYTCRISTRRHVTGWIMHVFDAHPKIN